MIRAERLVRSYGRTAVLTDATFEIASGECVGVIGPPGSGRSTLLQILATRIPADSGRAEVNGIDVRSRPFDARRALFHVGARGWSAVGMSAIEYVRLVAASRGVRTGGLSACADRAGLRAEAAVDTLTADERYRLELAAALVSGARVLLLDGPLDDRTAADASIRQALVREARDEGRTILMTGGVDVQWPARFCSRTFRLEAGRITALARTDVAGDLTWAVGV